jgi:hypothetical protein
MALGALRPSGGEPVCVRLDTAASAESDECAVELHYRVLERRFRRCGDLGADLALYLLALEAKQALAREAGAGAVFLRV